MRAQFRMAGIRLQVTSVDKFPRMTDYVVPGGVRIADADRTSWRTPRRGYHHYA